MRFPFRITRATEAESHEEEDYLFRVVGPWPSDKDLTPATYQELHAAAYEAYTGNPLAFRIIEILTAYLWGRGPTITAPDPAAQAALGDFWAANDMNRKGRAIVRELHLYGEQFLRHLPDGTLWQMDPSSVDELQTAPDNAQVVARIHQTAPDGGPGTWYAVPDEVQHFAIHKVSNALRGCSTLWVLLPWLRRYREWLTDRVRLNRGRSSWLWTVAVKSATPQKLRAKANQYAAPPEQGSLLFHADDEVWGAAAPNLEADDARADGHAIKLMIAAGAGIPIHWLSEVESGTRAVAAEMGGPSLRTFEAMQEEVAALLRDVLDRALVRRLGRVMPYTLTFPDLTPSDNREQTQALSALMPALGAAVDRGWMTKQPASGCSSSQGRRWGRQPRIARRNANINVKPQMNTDGVNQNPCLSVFIRGSRCFRRASARTYCRAIRARDHHRRQCLCPATIPGRSGRNASRHAGWVAFAEGQHRFLRVVPHERDQFRRFPSLLHCRPPLCPSVVIIIPHFSRRGAASLEIHRCDRRGKKMRNHRWTLLNADGNANPRLSVFTCGFGHGSRLPYNRAKRRIEGCDAALHPDGLNWHKKHCTTCSRHP